MGKAADYRCPALEAGHPCDWFDEGVMARRRGEPMLSNPWSVEEGRGRFRGESARSCWLLGWEREDLSLRTGEERTGGAS